ncbi:4-hydroxyphenylacetate 3-hydroxylase N-terminal domain-containing protein [Amycolatopsis rhabdoformis]|uniref:4-hydroxyphenylacetate 3-hydroxylase N-terminal domain-containing protein n=1 Tax=Amycolatopsis rhabdoformis TaxID=1448059 RepID=A0ABZ1IK51_9PSEU|nr:4-hydroxyphenylacetate 3-hydroxylase N-terminal domain-containing protein [Amycolatopsis rhabdoformis]WSE33979.1 4-hydroxyphenylacetate 3-hydroxylase N-terminal domain-containing protein [Amycolatopsis rhabdoformis]
MGLRTAKEYRDGLRDGRRVFYRGQRVDSVGDHPELTLAVDHSAHCFDIAQSHPELAVADGCSAFYRVPRSAEQLRARGELIETVSRLGGGIIVLKEVGSDAMFALLRTLEGEELERAKAFHERVCREDLALAVAQTDVKGDRSLAPHQQADPDLYLRIVAEDADSITVRGAKCHTSYSANADELIVLPTRAMGPEDADYAVSFAIPVDTPGLNIYVSPYLAGERNEFEFPCRRSTRCSRASRCSTTCGCRRSACSSTGARSWRDRWPSRSWTTTGSPRSTTSCHCSICWWVPRRWWRSTTASREPGT